MLSSLSIRRWVIAAPGSSGLASPLVLAGILAMSLLGVILYFVIHNHELRVNRHLYLGEQ